MSHELLIDEPVTAKEARHVCTNHHERLLAINDALDVLHGKWSIQLIGLLLFGGRMRFGEILRNMDGIGAKMLSKELQNLEANQIVTRSVLQTRPITVEYEITSYGKTLEGIIIPFVDWGMKHRKRMLQ